MEIKQEGKQFNKDFFYTEARKKNVKIPKVNKLIVQKGPERGKKGK